jgi:hypothetical protein
MYEAVVVGAISEISTSRRFATTATGRVTGRNLTPAWTDWQQSRILKPSHPICSPIAVVAEMIRLNCQCSSAKSLACTVLLVTLCNKDLVEKAVPGRTHSPNAYSLHFYLWLFLSLIFNFCRQLIIRVKILYSLCQFVRCTLKALIVFKLAIFVLENISLTYSM